jgi:hypothetical protein
MSDTRFKAKMFQNTRDDGKGAPWSNNRVNIPEAGEYRISLYQNDDGSMFISAYKKSPDERSRQGWEKPRPTRNYEERRNPEPEWDDRGRDWDDRF